MRIFRRMETCFLWRSPIGLPILNNSTGHLIRDILIKTLRDLRPILRTVFVLQDLEGLSTNQTAEVLGSSHAAVKSRLWRARLQLREGLNKYFTKQTTSGQAQPAPLGRHRSRLFDIVPESLHHSTSSSISFAEISFAESPHAPPTMSASDHLESGLNNA